MYTRIAVPLDGSALAEKALPTAEIIARATGASVHLISVLDGPPDPSISLLSPSYVMGEITARHHERREYLEHQAERIAGNGLTVRSEILDSSGDICSTILAFEQREKIDLTVLATHGRSGLTRWSLGSVAERLVQCGRVPVLLVRVRQRDTPAPQVVLPLDGSKAAEAALTAMQQLGTKLIGSIILLQIIDRPEQRAGALTYLKGVAGGLAVDGLQCQCRVEAGDPAEQILKIADTCMAVVMTTHGHSELLGRSLGIVAGRVAHHSAAPVLLVRVREEV